MGTRHADPLGCPRSRFWDPGTWHLKIAALALFPLDRLKESLEVALAEAPAALALDNLVEQSWPVLHGTREDLQHVALVVTIHQDSQLLQFLNRLVNPSHARL